MSDLFELLKDPDGAFQQTSALDAEMAAAGFMQDEPAVEPAAAELEPAGTADALQPYSTDLDYLQDHFDVVAARLKMYMTDMDTGAKYYAETKNPDLVRGRLYDMFGHVWQHFDRKHWRFCRHAS